MEPPRIHGLHCMLVFHALWNLSSFYQSALFLHHFGDDFKSHTFQLTLLSVKNLNTHFTDKVDSGRNLLIFLQDTYQFNCSQCPELIPVPSPAVLLFSHSCLSFTTQSITIGILTDALTLPLNLALLRAFIFL